MTRKNHAKTRGGAMLELALLSPWIVFLFVGALDWGFYAYSLIALENATRSAAVYTSASTGNSTDSATACQILVNQMSTVINMSGVNTCSGAPLSLSLSTVTGPDNTDASQVSVTYTTPLL